MKNRSAIHLDNVSVRYRVPREQLSGIKEFAIRWVQRRLQYRQFLALQEICLDIQPGEIFGVIGPNGAGKSTLLKVMARVLKPSQGRVVVIGRTAPLLDVAAGFHPELTGVENIFLNGALLGYTRREIEDQFEEIITFAGIEEFIEAPIRTYSTGMVARLGFAIATNARPDILLVDEVLSVGDASFQEECITRMTAYRENGTTIVLVSHGLALVQNICQRAICVEGGKIAARGKAVEVVQKYMQAGT